MKPKGSDRILRTVSEVEIMNQIDHMALKDVRNVGFFINNYCIHYSVKLKKLHDGISHTSRLIHAQTSFLEKSREELEKRRLEIVKINQLIARGEKTNERIKGKIKREAEKTRSYETNLAALKNQKKEIGRMKRDVGRDMDFMKSSIAHIMNQHDSDLVTYRKILKGKDQFKNEAGHFKKERRTLEHNIKELQISEDTLMTNMKKLVYDINKNM